MPSLLSKIIKLIKRNIPDSQIVGDVKFHQDNIPFFTISMDGCNTLVDINAEDIIEKFTDKFSQSDIKNATKAFMKYRCLLKLASIEKNYAILHDKNNNRYQLIDLSDSNLPYSINFDLLKSEDAFILGTHFERERLEKDRRLLRLTRSGQNVKKLALVKSHG